MPPYSSPGRSGGPALAAWHRIEQRVPQEDGVCLLDLGAAEDVDRAYHRIARAAPVSTRPARPGQQGKLNHSGTRVWTFNIVDPAFKAAGLSVLHGH